MDKLATIWQEIPLWVKTILSDFSIVIFVLIIGKILAFFFSEKMKELRLNEHFKIPVSFSKREEENENGASNIISFLISITVWGYGICWILENHQFKDSIANFLKISSKLWTVGLFIGLAFFCGNLLTRGILGLFRNSFLSQKIDSLADNSGSRGEPFSESLAKAMGAFIFVSTLLVVFLGFAELFNLSVTLTALSALWNFEIRLFSVLVTILIGWLGINFISKSQNSLPPANESTRFLENNASLAIAIVTVLVAIDLLTPHGSFILFAAILVMVVLCFAPYQEALYDLYAGINLKYNKVRKIVMDGKHFSITNIGLLKSSLSGTDGTVQQFPNRKILDVYFQTRSEPFNH
ncbi:MAG: hypothetical protein HQM08_26210 [Candidatus Riflebacteria bacterium]|nr:hypothetical protein [Candidatus Riflebacteria bacterium]